MTPIILKQNEYRKSLKVQAPIKVTRSNQGYNSGIWCAECGKEFVMSNKELMDKRLWLVSCPYCRHYIEFESRKLSSRTREISYHNI